MTLHKNTEGKNAPVPYRSNHSTCVWSTVRISVTYDKPLTRCVLMLAVITLGLHKVTNSSQLCWETFLKGNTEVCLFTGIVWRNQRPSYSPSDRDKCVGWWDGCQSREQVSSTPINQSIYNTVRSVLQRDLEVVVTLILYIFLQKFRLLSALSSWPSVTNGYIDCSYF